MSTHEKLAAASNDRKSRLAQLKSLKRKQAPTDDSPSSQDAALQAATDDSPSSTALTVAEQPPVTATYLSGRNFDATTRTLKLGYTAPPIADETATLEYQAGQLALESRAQQEQEKREADSGLDLFKLQPKRPNWDLKRDLQDKTRLLDGQTANALAAAVRERVEGQKLAVEGRGKDGEGEGEEVGMEGSELVEAMHVKEQEEESERRREAEEEEGS